MIKKEKKVLKVDVKDEMSKLLGFIDFNSIITFNEKTGVVFIGGERVDEGKLTNLKSESEFILHSDMWKVMSETIRHLAYEMMFIKSTSFEDMKSGKMLLYHLDIQKKIMDILASYKKPAPVVK